MRCRDAGTGESIMPPDHPFSGLLNHSYHHSGRGRRWVCAWGFTLLALLVVAPSAFAWNGSLEVRKVNIGGPSTDAFTFKVESGAYGQPDFTLVPSSDYTGAPWKNQSKPDNPFTLVGAPGPSGPFTTTGDNPTAALFTELDSGGQTAAAPPAVRDWRRFRVTESAKPGYTTAVACGIRNNASGAGWDASLDAPWGAWTATTTNAGGGDGVETTLRFLPDTVAPDARGPWTATCTFTNTYVGNGGTTPPPTGGTQAAGPTPGVTPAPPGVTSPPPSGPVTGSAPPIAGTARVEGANSCVTGAYAIADVRGRGIVRVVFRVNGRVVKTLTNANVAGMFRLKVPASSLPRGASRATADVRFRAASKLAPKRLAFAFSRCPRRAGRPPTFTG
jgi:hypothetical protein